MQKIIIARTLALSLAAGILFTACSDNNTQKAEGDQATEVAKVDNATTDVTAGLGGNEPLDRLKQAPKELGKSLGRVMDTITEPVKKAFAPRVESKEMEKNTKAEMELLVLKKIDTQVVRVLQTIDPQYRLKTDLSYEQYDVRLTLSKRLEYRVILKVKFRQSRVNGKNSTKHIPYNISEDHFYVLVATRTPDVDEKGNIVYSALQRVHIWHAEDLDIAHSYLPELEKKYL